ncbi:hypothetical protein A5713_06105 [Mycobacterium sp. E2497]|nr:hypothetical protein A9X04_07085 [Mycobacterium sp. E3247]OBI11794.1 hypothetical protein A5713_06105 [Mycobacterium sp. E2497]
MRALCSHPGRLVWGLRRFRSGFMQALRRHRRRVTRTGPRHGTRFAGICRGRALMLPLDRRRSPLMRTPDGRRLVRTF